MITSNVDASWRLVHIPRTGGTTFADAYGYGFAGRSRPAHTPASRFPGVRKFAFFRNPWARAVSIYHYWYGRPDQARPTFTAWVLEDGCRLAGGDLQIPGTVLRLESPQVMWLDTSEPVDLLLTEYWSAEVERLAAALDLPAVTPPDVAAKSTHDAWLLYYTERTFERVAQLYAADVQIYGLLRQKRGNHGG